MQDHFETPSSPSSRPPPVGGYAIFDGGCMLLFALVWTSISLIMLIGLISITISEWQIYTLLQNTGATTEAVITSRRIYDDSDDDDYYVEYQYTALLPQGDSQRFTQEEEVSRHSYDALPPETRTPILYALTDPAISRLQLEFESPLGLLTWFAFGFIGLFVLIGAVLLFSGGQKLLRALQLRIQGQLIQGTIFDCWVEKDSDGDNQYLISYQFDDSQNGPVVRAEYNQKAYHKLQIGDRVQIRYIPGNTEVCHLVL